MDNEELNSKAPFEDPQEVSLKDLFLKIGVWRRYIVSRWLIIVIAGIIGAAVGLLYSLVKPTSFLAETTFVLEEEGSGGGMLGQLGGLAGLAGIDIASGGGLFEGDNIIQLYRSRSMIEKALLSPIDNGNKKQLLLDRYLMAKSKRNNAGLKGNDFIRSSSNRVKDSILTNIIKDINKNYLNVSRPDKKLSIISVRVSFEDEIFAKEFVEELVENVSSFYVETKTKKSLQNVNILQRQTDSVRAVMEGAIYTSARTIDATPNLNPARQTLRSPAQRSQFNAEANKEVLSELIKNLELSKMALRKETPLIQVIDSPVYPLPNDKLGKTRAIVFGGAIMGFLSIMLIVVIKFYKNIING